MADIPKKSRRPRRQFDEDFKAQAVRLVLDERKTARGELADRFASCSEAKMELFDYIEVFYNQRRRHSTLGQISPAEFEIRASTRRR
jgi:hypothetical protein